MIRTIVSFAGDEEVTAEQFHRVHNTPFPGYRKRIRRLILDGVMHKFLVIEEDATQPTIDWGYYGE